MEEIGYLMVQTFILFCTAEVLGKIFSKLGLPEIVGYIVSGAVFVNLAIFTGFGDFIEFDVDSVLHEPSNFINVMGNLGLVFMLFGIGLETKLSEMMNIGRKAFATAIFGISFPFCGGVAAYFIFGDQYRSAIMVGTALFAMSTVVCAHLLNGMGIIDSAIGRLVIGVAILCDVLCLILMAMNVALVGSVSDPMVVLDIATILLFILFVILFIWHTSRRVKNRTSNVETLFASIDLSHRDLFTIAVILCLALTASSYVVGLSGIVGAFLAGMYFAEFEKTTHIIEKFDTLTKFLLPLFFIMVGLRLRMDEMTVNSILIAVVLAVVAIAFRIVGGYIGARIGGIKKESALFVSACMVPRGDISIVVASLALSMGLFDTDLYAGVIMMSVITQVCAYPLMRRTFSGLADTDPDVVKAD